MKVNVIGAILPDTLSLPDGSNALKVTQADYGDVVELVNVDLSSQNITSGAWVELVDFTTEEIFAAEIFMSNGNALELAIGGVGSEVPKVQIFPGGNDETKGVKIPAGSRISARAIDQSLTSGRLLINFLGES